MNLFECVCIRYVCMTVCVCVCVCVCVSMCVKETRAWRPDHRASRAEEVCSDTSTTTLG